jgi:hypothetical protein
VKIKADINGASTDGIVKARSTVSRHCETSVGCTEALVAEAIKEWLRFEKRTGSIADPFFKFVSQMWQSIGPALDGKDRDTPCPLRYLFHSPSCRTELHQV